MVKKGGREGAGRRREVRQRETMSNMRKTRDPGDRKEGGGLQACRDGSVSLEDREMTEGV